MRGKKDTQKRVGISIWDRLACALLSGVSALALGSVIWFGLSWKLAQSGIPSFSWVLAISLVAAVLGFLVMDNVVVGLVIGLVELLLFVGGM